MLKKSILAMFVVAIAATAVAFADKRQVVLDRVVAVVGGSSILQSEVQMMAKQLVEQRRSEGYTSDRDPMNEGLEELMKQKLLYSQALIDSVVVGAEGRIEAQVEDILQKMIAEAGSVKELEAKEHMPLFNYRDILRHKITEQLYAEEMRMNVVQNVVVTPGEVEHFYKELKEEDKPLVPEQFVYAHIVRFPASQEEAKRRTKERLLDMRERIISGKSNMAVLARTYSQDPGSAMKGGEYPPGPLSTLTAPFAEALAKLKPGQISEVVESEFGFHIIELLEEPKNGMYRYRHILLKPVYTIEEETEPLNYLDSLSTLIKADSISFEEAALKHSQDNLTKMNGGLVTNHDLLMRYNANNVKYTATKFRREDFSARQQDYMNLITMKKGDVSQAFVALDINGNVISKIVKLLEVIPTHSATLEEDYVSIEEMALSDKKTKVFDKWLKEKIDGLYVYIDPEFREGEWEYPNWVK
ncbi:MAG: peptidylprolyl isomerase [Rikenellaceae bacterium]|nr:peptidylprolyl isomerase [Rikenellaceae bacterium]